MAFPRNIRAVSQTLRQMLVFNVKSVIPKCHIKTIFLFSGGHNHIDDTFTGLFVLNCYVKVISANLKSYKGIDLIKH